MSDLRGIKTKLVVMQRKRPAADETPASSSSSSNKSNSSKKFANNIISMQTVPNLLPTISMMEADLKW